VKIKDGAGKWWPQARVGIICASGKVVRHGESHTVIVAVKSDPEIHPKIHPRIHPRNSCAIR